MEKNQITFQISDSSRKFSFENNIVIIRDKDFISSLNKSYAKNKVMGLKIIDSNKNEINDVVQIKINMNKVGFFMANFAQNSFNENQGKKILNELSMLKTDNKLSEAQQIEKIKTLIKIVNKYNPLYVSFDKLESFKLDINKLADVELNFPLLVLDKEHMISVKKNSKFSLPTILSFIIPLLGSCSALVGSYEYVGGNKLYLLYWITAIILVAAEAFSLKLYLIKDKKPRTRKALLMIILFSLLGLGIGYAINKMLLHISLDKIGTIETLAITTFVSLELYLSSLLIAKLLNRAKSK